MLRLRKGRRWLPQPVASRRVAPDSTPESFNVNVEAPPLSFSPETGMNSDCAVETLHELFEVPGLCTGAYHDLLITKPGLDQTQH